MLGSKVWILARLLSIAIYLDCSVSLSRKISSVCYCSCREAVPWIIAISSLSVSIFVFYCVHLASLPAAIMPRSNLLSHLLSSGRCLGGNPLHYHILKELPSLLHITERQQAYMLALNIAGRHSSWAIRNQELSPSQDMWSLLLHPMDLHTK